jgi:hypothetical protein
MRNAIGSRSLLRAGIASLINGALLTAGQPRREPDPNAVTDWVASQIAFFGKRTKERELWLKGVGVVSWALFGAAIGVGSYDPDLVRGLSGRVAQFLLLGTKPDLAVALGLVGLLWLWRRSRPRRAATVIVWFGIAALAGCVIADALYPLLLADPRPAPPQDLAERPRHIFGMASVLLTGLAVALRYMIEKLSWEAEARSYEEALVLFRFAAERLAELKQKGPAGDGERQRLVRELGTAALAENEAWVRAHRERPLEPVVG